METVQPNPKSREELDLSQFFNMIGRGIRNVGNNVLYGIASLRNLFFDNVKFFIATLVVCLSLGAIYSKFLKKKYYKSSMVLSCATFNKQIMTNTIDKLNQLCGDKKTIGLATELKIPDSLAKQILSFDFEPFITEQEVIELEVLKQQLNTVVEEKKELAEKIIHRLTIENKDAYKISVTVSTPTTVLALQEPLIKYFENNDYIKRRLEIHKQTRLERKEKLTEESRKLDSLKKVIFNNVTKKNTPERGSNNVILNENEQHHNPLDFVYADLSLNSQIIELESQLFLRPDFELIDGFTPYTTPESPGLMKILLVSFFGSFIIGYVILFAVRFDKMLSTFPTDKK